MTGDQIIGIFFLLGMIAVVGEKFKAMIIALPWYQQRQARRAAVAGIDRWAAHEREVARASAIRAALADAVQAMEGDTPNMADAEAATQLALSLLRKA